jgi:hypothetical protein
MRGMRRTVVLAIVAVLGPTLAACSSGGSDTPSPQASGCTEVTALKSSVTTLTQVNPVTDGVAALKSAAAHVQAKLSAAVTAASSELQPAVTQVKNAFAGLETALKGVSSAGSLGSAATQVGTALTAVGTSLTGLSSAVAQTCASPPSS